MPPPPSSLRSPLASLQSGLSAYRARAKEQWKAHTFFTSMHAADAGSSNSAGGSAGQWRTEQACSLTAKVRAALRGCWNSARHCSAKCSVYAAAIWSSDEQSLIIPDSSSKLRSVARRQRTTAALLLILLLLLLAGMLYHLMRWG
jgi:hypothetical protein